MPYTLEHFMGRYTIRHGGGLIGLIEPGFWLCIGTGEFNDPPSDGTRIGISIVDPSARRRVLPVADHPPAFAYLVKGTLNGSSYWLGEDDPQLLTYQVSLMTIRLNDRKLYKAPSFVVTIGDPRNAGVWGADDESDG